MITDFYNVTTPAATDPVSLAEAKLWLRIDDDITEDDALITALITAATAAGEKFCNRVFVQRTIEGFFNGLDASNRELYPYLQVRRAPLISISSVEVYSADAYAAFTDYLLRQQSGFSRLIFTNGITDADPDYDAVYPVKITFIAGYGADSDVPEDIKTAIKAHINFLYENRGDVIADGKLGMPLETKAIYSGKYRILNTF